jgi:hypothetical protein
MSTAACWVEAPTEEMHRAKMINHMVEHGVFEEAERMMDRLDDGAPSPVLSAAEVRERLAPYL